MFKKSVNYSRILICSDSHLPNHHEDTIDFYSAIINKLKPTYCCHVGDLCDFSSLQVNRNIDPNIDSPVLELTKTREAIKEFEKLFPKLDITYGNHDLRLQRKSENMGIPSDFIKGFNQLLNITADWKWHQKLLIPLPSGQDLFVTHNFKANILQSAMGLNCCFACGHFHTQMQLSYASSPTQLYWAMCVGTTLNPKSDAFKYQRTFVKRPLLGCGIVIDSIPQIIPMILDKHGRWTGKIRI